MPFARNCPHSIDTDSGDPAHGNDLLSRVTPSVTNMIRLDHTHVLSTFHQFKPDAPARVKRGLVNTICTALEVHAQLEEEIFYRRYERSWKTRRSAKASMSTRRCEG